MQTRSIRSTGILKLTQYQGSGTTILRNTLSKVRVSRGTAPLAVPSTFRTAKIANTITEINQIQAIETRAADRFLAFSLATLLGSLVSGPSGTQVVMWCNNHTA